MIAHHADMLLVIDSRFVLSFFSPLTKTSKLSPNSAFAMNMVLELNRTSKKLLDCIVLLPISATLALNIVWLVVSSSEKESNAILEKLLDCFAPLHCRVIRRANFRWVRATESEEELKRTN